MKSCMSVTLMFAGSSESIETSESLPPLPMSAARASGLVVAAAMPIALPHACDANEFWCACVVRAALLGVLDEGTGFALMNADG